MYSTNFGGVKSMQFIPQSASDTPFRIPMSAVSHSDLLGFKPERSKNIHYLYYRIFVTNKKCCIIGVNRIYRNILLKILIPLILLFSLM